MACVWLRLKFEFEDRVSDASENDESQDWFVNDKRDDDRAPSPTKSENAAGKDANDSPTNKTSGAASASGPPPHPGLMMKKSSKLALTIKKSNTVETADEVMNIVELIVRKWFWK